MSAAPPSFEPATRRAFRLALGVTLAFSLAQVFDWPVSLLAPTATVAFLQDAKAMPFWTGFKTILLAMAGLGGCFLIALALSHYPFVMVLTYGVLFTLLFRFVLTTGQHPIVFVGLLVGCTVIPLLVRFWPELALVATLGAMASFLIAWFVATLTFALMAPPESLPPGHEHDDVQFDLHSVSVILGIILASLLAVFLYFGLTDILVLVYGTLFALSLSTKAVKETFVSYLLANLIIAGLATILVYEALVIAPSFSLMIALVFLVMYVLSLVSFGHSDSAGAFASACFGFILLLSGTLPKEGIMASEKVIDRASQIGMAALYVALVFGVLEFVQRLKTLCPAEAADD